MSKPKKAAVAKKTDEPKKAAVAKGSDIVKTTLAKTFTSTVHGNLSKGDNINIERSLYNQWLAVGYVEKI